MSDYKGDEVNGGTCWECGTKRERIAELEAENTALKCDLDAADLANRDLKELVESCSRRNESDCDTIATLQAKIGRLTSRGIEDLRFENEQLNAENAELKAAGRNLFNALEARQFAKENRPVEPWPDIAPFANALGDLLEDSSNE